MAGARGMIAEAIKRALPEVTSLLAARGVDRDDLIYGEPIVLDHLAHDEPALALAHLRYMIRAPGLPISSSTEALLEWVTEIMERDPRL